MKVQLLAAGGILSALAASTCCVLPLLLVSLGVSGAWIGSLTALAPYQPVFLVAALVSLGAGFWLVYGSRQRTCPAVIGKGLRRFLAGFLSVKGALWIGASLIALAMGIDFGLPLLM